MKKIIALSAVIAIMTAFASCSDKETADKSSSKETTTAATTVTTENEATTAEQTTESEEISTTEESTTETKAADENVQEYKEAAIELMKAMTAAEKLGSGIVACDGNQTLSTDANYFKVTDTTIDSYDISSLEKIKTFLSDHFSGEFYNREAYLVEGDDPFFTEGDDGLYSHLGGRAFIYGWDKYEPEIISTGDNEFTARAEYELTNGLTQVDMHIIKNDDTWRVDSVVETPLN